MSKTYFVGLCGMSARDTRLIEIVLNRAPNARHKFEVADATSRSVVDIAVVDLQSPVGLEILNTVRVRNPMVVVVAVSDHGMMGETRFRISRRSLLLQLHRTLEQIVDEELSGAAKVRSLPPSDRPTTQPAPAPSSTDQALLAPTAGVAPKSHSEFPPLVALVVDDSLTVRRQLEAALDRAGIQVVLAEDAEAAQRELVRKRFDLMFLDVVMPGIDGYELCRSIKQNQYTRGVPVLMLTSRSSPFDRARGALAGCDSYLVKPITWEGFYSAVDRTLSKSFQNDRKLLAARGYRYNQA